MLGSLLCPHVHGSSHIASNEERSGEECVDMGLGFKSSVQCPGIQVSACRGFRSLSGFRVHDKVRRTSPCQ